ncbi:MAG: Gfo/Idh/MocA family oxidoreductase [Pseudomonadota bacterium]
MIGVAILGAGIGAQHLAAYRALPAQFAVRTICDLDLDRARAMVGPDNGIRLTDKLAEVYADPSVELVDICLPPHLHAEVAIAALKAGKHVICEKPLATSLKDADRIAAAADRAASWVFPVFQYRFGHGIRALKALMEAGLTGAALSADLETHWDRRADYYCVPWRGSWATEGGGAVLIHAIHIHDLMTHLLGPVAEVSAMLTTRANPIETEDCGAIAFRLVSGAVATSSVTLGAAGDHSRLRIAFERLTAQSDTLPYDPGGGRWSFAARSAEDQALVEACLADLPEAPGGFEGFLQGVAGCLKDGAPPPVSLVDGRRSIELVSAIYEANRRGRVTQLPIGRRRVSYRGWMPLEKV